MSISTAPSTPAEFLAVTINESGANDTAATVDGKVSSVLRCGSDEKMW